jgi:dehydrogenase
MFCPYLKGTGVDVQGGHAEYMLMNADATYLIPDKVSYEQAAPIFCAGYTVYSGLRWADPKPHERVAVLGIGGLGHLAVQYAKAAGFETIAISHSPDKDKLIRDLGADEIVREGKTLAAAGGPTSSSALPIRPNRWWTAFRGCGQTAGSSQWGPTRSRFRSR